MGKAAPKAKSISRSRIRRRLSLRRVAAWVAVLCLAAAAYVGYRFISEHQATTEQKTAQNTPKNSAEPVQPKTSPPKYLSIPSLSISRATIVPVGINDDGSMADPNNYQHVGWYKESAKPGDGKGALLLNGHYGAANETAIFQYLNNIKTGDTIVVEDTKSKSINYKVYFVEQLPARQVDMRKMLRSADPSHEGLNIITCGGNFDADKETYDDRVLVYAVRTN